VNPSDAAERFSERAGAYDSYRPAYPAAALDALLRGLGSPEELIVADIGAGTGIATRQLSQRVAQVIAVEPSAKMRACAETLPNVTWQDGTAEHTGLPEKSVDVAAAFQAFHWFDAVDAFREFKRIARRRVGMVQYERNEQHPFSAAYGALVRRYAVDDTEALRARTLETFRTLAGAAVREAEVAFSQELTLEGLRGRVDSTSYLPREGAQAEALRRDVGDLFERFQRRGFVEMAMTAYVLAAGV
jgi:ubiquinone/menaquinone biosynthesis C-methylase UbiE